jgi:hypothetical protein
MYKAALAFLSFFNRVGRLLVENKSITTDLHSHRDRIEEMVLNMEWKRNRHVKGQMRHEKRRHQQSKRGVLFPYPYATDAMAQTLCFHTVT